MLPLSTIEAQEPEEVQTKPPKKGGETGKLWAGGSGEVSTRWGSMDPEDWPHHQMSPLALLGRDTQDAASLTSPPVSGSHHGPLGAPGS